MKILAALMLVLPVAVCAQQQGTATCTSALRASMRDPDSMRLVRILPPDPRPFEFSGVRVRGYEMVINARNGFGGFTGDTLFMCLVDAATERTVVLLRQQ